MRRYLITASILLAISSPYAVAKDDYSATYGFCVAKAEGITTNINDCNKDELKKQDARLNNAYKSAMAVLPTGQKAKLRDTQRIWIKYRDADCGMYYSLTSGTMDMLNGVGCELRMTHERADALEWFAENGGD